MDVPKPPDLRTTSGARVAATLLALGAALHIVMLFPAQGRLVPAFDAHTSLVVQQAILAAGWLVAAVLVARAGPVAVTAGAALAAGMALAEAGVVAANLAQILSESTAGAGAWLFVAAWAEGLFGATAALGLAARRRPAVLGRPGGRVGGEGVVAAATGAAAIVVGIALLPAWDHYTITSSVLHRTIGAESLGSAFATGTPGGVLAGDLLTAVAFALVPLVALGWRPGRFGVLLSGGVLVVVASQVASGLVGFRNSPADFGITAAQVSRYGVQVHSSLTSSFVLELIAGAALLLLLITRWWATPGGWTSEARPRTGAGLPRPPWAFDPTPPPAAGVGGGWGPPVRPQPDLPPGPAGAPAYPPPW